MCVFFIERFGDLRVAFDRELSDLLVSLEENRAEVGLLGVLLLLERLAREEGLLSLRGHGGVEAVSKFDLEEFCVRLRQELFFEFRFF